jgi:hypothetical protein
VDGGGDRGGGEGVRRLRAPAVGPDPGVVELERAGTWGDPRSVEALVGETLEGLKMFEYALRRELEGTDPEKLRLSGSDEVPEGWRSLVEEYYRSLAKDES